MLTTSYVEGIINTRRMDIWKKLYNMLYDPHQDIVNSLIDSSYISICKFIFPENRMYNFLSSGMVMRIEDSVWRHSDG
jgi:hypothetical protein